MQSRFSHNTYLLVFGIIFIPIVCLAVTMSENLNIGFNALFTIPVLFFLLRDLKVKAAKIEIDNDKIIIKNFLGLGSEKVYSLTEIEGYYTSVINDEDDFQKMLYVVYKQKKIATISSLYHSNYDELQMWITTECELKNLKPTL